MKALIAGIAVFVAITQSLHALAADDQTNQAPRQLHMELELTDGSHVIGMPRLASVPLQTPYAKVDIALEQIVRIRLSDDHETASLELQNGDHITGSLSLPPIQLDTLFGGVSVGIQNIMGVRVRAGGYTREGLVLHYSFDRDEGATIRDMSGKQNHATAHGARWVSDGKVQGACVLDGKDDYVECESRFGLSMSHPFTLAAWVKPTSVDGQGSAGRLIIGKWYDINNTDLRQYALGFVGGGSPVFVIGAGSTYEEVRSSEKIPAGFWSHVAGVYDGSELTIYLNGTPTGRKPTKQVIADVNVNVSIGKRALGDFGAQYLGGCVDEVMIWTRALSEREVKQLYNSQN